MAADKFQVQQEGAPVSPMLDTEDAALTWIEQNQPRSVDHALNFGGYRIVTLHPIATAPERSVVDLDKVGG